MREITSIKNNLIFFGRHNTEVQRIHIHGFWCWKKSLNLGQSNTFRRERPIDHEDDAESEIRSLYDPALVPELSQYPCG